MNLKNSLGVVLSMTLLSSSLSHAKGDPKVGETKAVTCAACHGAKGISPNDEWPNLAGQKYTYLVSSLKAFKSGARKNTLMSPQAMIINDADIEHLAAYFSSLK
jgi:cytochrome c553